MLTLYETYNHWFVAILTVTVHFINFMVLVCYLLLNFFQLGCFLHSIESVNSIAFIAGYDSGFPYICVVDASYALLLNVHKVVTLNVSYTVA